MDMETTLGMPSAVHRWMLSDIRKAMAALKGIAELNEMGERQDIARSN